MSFISNYTKQNWQLLIISTIISRIEFERFLYCFFFQVILLVIFGTTLAFPEPHSTKGTSFGSSHGGLSKRRTIHIPLGSHGFRGVGGGHATRKREASPDPDPHSTHGTSFGSSHAGFTRPKQPHVPLGSHGFHGVGGGHGTRWSILKLETNLIFAGCVCFKTFSAIFVFLRLASF